MFNAVYKHTVLTDLAIQFFRLQIFTSNLPLKERIIIKNLSFKIQNRCIFKVSMLMLNSHYK